MRLSVVIPTRQRDHHLRRCLERLDPVVQRADAEIVVTDDGNSESTRRMIEAEFPAVRWVAGPQRGPAANRNHGASVTTGELLVFVDDDVVPSAGLLRAYLAAHTPEVHVYEGRTTCEAGLRSPFESAPINETGGWLWSCNMMLRRSLWQSMGGFDEAFRFPHMEDVAFRERIRALGHEIRFVPDAVVDHPPRRIPGLRARARQHESHFIYSYKYLGSRPSRLQFLIDRARYMFHLIGQRPKSADSVQALASFSAEAVLVFARWRTWDAQFQGLGAHPVLPPEYVRTRPR
jgi:GT2 family glycosyltransferase